MAIRFAGKACDLSRTPSSLALGLGLGLLSVGANAQQASGPVAPAAETPTQGDIVVTATKRAESIQKVPASISAVGGLQLQQQRVTQIGDLGNIVPNLQTVAAAGEGEPNFSLRGISLSDATASSQGPIAIYYDEVYKGSHPIQGIDLFDLERVEVLRGPQGTLYGRNASGGAINFISRTPGFDTTGDLSVGYGNFNRYEASGAIQTGLTGTLAVRGAFTFVKSRGYVDNVYPGQPNPNGTNYFGLRLSTLWNPTDRLSFLLRVSGSRQNGTNYTLFPTTTPPVAPFDFVTRPNTCVAGLLGVGQGVGCGLYGAPYFRNGLKKFQIDSDYVPKYYHATYAFALTTDYDLSDSLKLTSITSYDHGSLKAPEDGDGSPLRVFEVTATNARTKQVAQDLRLTSSFSGPFNFILGGYYNRESSSNDTAYVFKADGGSVCDLFLLAGCLGESTGQLVRKTLAVYSDVSFKIGSQFTLRGGLRYTDDRGNLRNYTGGYYNLGDGSSAVFYDVVPVEGVKIDHLDSGYRTRKITGKAGLDYQATRDILLYASFSTGFRGSGFNVAAQDEPGQIAPSKAETVRSLEAGFKSQLINNAITLNAAFYDYRYHNQQAQDLVDNVAFLRALPKSHLYGVEVETTIRPVRTVRINGGFGYTHSRIEEGVFRGIDIAGNVLAQAPKYTVTLGGEWDFLKLDPGVFTINVNGSYTSKQYYDIYNSDFISQGKYALFNGNLRFRTANSKYGATIWARNVTNKFYYNYRADTSFFGATTGTIGAPRTFGASLDAKF